MNLIGELKNSNLVDDNEIAEILTALIEDTALLDLINEVQMYYSGANVVQPRYQPLKQT